MYCKKCGRKLEDGMRFCDRCGQSVRLSQNGGRREDDGQQEPLSRKQKQRDKNDRKNQSGPASKRTAVLVVIFAVLFCILVIAVIAYNITINKSENAPWRTTDGPVEMNATAVPAVTPTPEGAATSPPSATAYAITGEANADGYREFKCTGGAVFMYPSTFMQQNTGENARLSLYDAGGGGAITLSETGPVSGEARDLMSDYASAQEGSVSYSRAGDGWYIVETESGDFVNHRKCVIVNNIAIAYDFSYSASASAAELYKEQISYMDEHFNP